MHFFTKTDEIIFESTVLLLHIIHEAYYELLTHAANYMYKKQLLTI